ncbi:MAG: protein O-mannosyl-transferase family [Anaerolineae bacterium]
MQSKHLRPLSLSDYIIPVLIGLVAFFGYRSTLAPTVLDGDAALFQYTPAVLGVTYPTGYPTYVLFGFLWQTLLPLGSVAYRMNLFSAVCAALALAFLYPATRHLLESRIAALCSVAIFATLPTFWRWATEAKIYTLHIMLLSAMLMVLSRPERLKQPRTWLIWAVLFGLAAGNHSTTLLLAPGLLLMFWLGLRQWDAGQSHQSGWTQRYIVYLLPAVILPALLYMYVPVRAEWLLGEHGELSGLTVPVAVARGLVSEYYHTGWAGWVRYFTAADFTGGVVRNWGHLLSDMQTVYYPLMRDEFTLWGLVWAAAGALYYAIWRPRRFWPLCLLHGALVPFVLTYGQGEQSAFLLPASLTLAIFVGAGVAAVLRLTQAAGTYIQGKFLAATQNGPTGAVQITLQLAVLAAVAFFSHHQSDHNVRWLTKKWNDAAYRYWTDALAHPIEPGAGILAHWGDLTTFWYLQHAEGLRYDLYGIYPPQASVIATWLAAGHGLYIAAPLQEGIAELTARYQLLPWGRLVRIIPPEIPLDTVLPELPAVPDGVLFGERLKLTRASWDTSVASGEPLPVTLIWHTTDDLPADVRISLRLTDEREKNVTQLDDTLLSGWLPTSFIPAKRLLLSFNRLRIPAGILPGTYQLQVGVYRKGENEWQLPNGRTRYVLGNVEVTPAQPGAPADPWQEFKPAPQVVFGDAIRLVGYDYSVTRARQGRGFALRLLWQVERRPTEDYTLQVELIDSLGRVWRDWQYISAGGRLPTSHWDKGQTVRDEIPIVLPALAPPGEHTIWMRLTWLREDGSHLPARYGWIPLGDSALLPGVRVIEQEGRTFEMLPYTYAVGANFGDKALLVGYNLPERCVCPGGVLPLELVWRSLSSDMRASYTVFVHLVDRDGNMIAQMDKEPGTRGKRPTTSWVRDEIIGDPIPLTLPSDSPPGVYRLVVGLYTVSDGVRLPLRSVSGELRGDSLTLTEIQVVAREGVDVPGGTCR